MGTVVISPPIFPRHGTGLLVELAFPVLGWSPAPFIHPSSIAQGIHLTAAWLHPLHVWCFVTPALQNYSCSFVLTPTELKLKRDHNKRTFQLFYSMRAKAWSRADRL